MEQISYVILGFSFSFIGSIPLGMITLTIIQRSAHHGKIAGLGVSLGATIAEFVYTAIALYFLDYFLGNLTFNRNIKIFSIIIFILIGSFYFFRVQTAKSRGTSGLSNNHLGNFSRGFIVGHMNLLIIPYWILIGTFLETRGIYFSDLNRILVFSISAAVGALAVFLLYVLLVDFVISRFQMIVRYTNKVVGALFYVLALVQLGSIFLTH